MHRQYRMSDERTTSSSCMLLSQAPSPTRLLTGTTLGPLIAQTSSLVIEVIEDAQSQTSDTPPGQTSNGRDRQEGMYESPSLNKFYRSTGSSASVPFHPPELWTLVHWSRADVVWPGSIRGAMEVVSPGFRHHQGQVLRDLRLGREGNSGWLLNVSYSER